MDYTNEKHDDKTLNFLNGILRDSLFQWILSLIRSDNASIYYPSWLILQTTS